MAHGVLTPGQYRHQSAVALGQEWILVHIDDPIVEIK